MHHMARSYAGSPNMKVDRISTLYNSSLYTRCLRARHIEIVIHSRKTLSALHRLVSSPTLALPPAWLARESLLMQTPLSLPHPARLRLGSGSLHPRALTLALFDASVVCTGQSQSPEMGLEASTVES